MRQDVGDREMRIIAAWFTEQIRKFD